MLGGSQDGRLVQEGAHPIEVFASGRMEPAKEADAVEAGRQHMLEETADELLRLKGQRAWLAGGAVAIGPSQPSVGP